MDPDIMELLVAALVTTKRLAERLRAHSPRRTGCRCIDCLAELDSEIVAINIRRRLAKVPGVPEEIITKEPEDQTPAHSSGGSDAVA